MKINKQIERFTKSDNVTGPDNTSGSDLSNNFHGPESTSFASQGLDTRNADSKPALSRRPDQFLVLQLESLKRKHRSDAFINRLTYDQSIQLVEWIQCIENLDEVRNYIQAPPPNGFGLEVSISALSRFRSFCRAELIANGLEEMLDTALDLEQKSGDTQNSHLQGAINVMLHKKAFQLARTRPNSDDLRHLLSNIQKLSALEYKRQKLALEREKMKRRDSISAPSNLPARHHRVDLRVIPAESALPAPGGTPACR